MCTKKVDTTEQQEGDKENSRKQNMAAESNHIGEAGAAFQGEEGQKFNKKSKKGDERVPHSQKDFGLKGLHREKWEPIQHSKKDKAGSGNTEKNFVGDKKGVQGFGPPAEWAQ